MVPPKTAKDPILGRVFEVFCIFSGEQNENFLDLSVLGEKFEAADELHLFPVFEDLGDGVAQAALLVLPDF